ncbi:putative conserved membrane protein [Mycobacterium xenopi 4042]|uniref:Putative conserved membrane protein n=1 Tax=Mycobacterium xenopi 4042 TaxID=1299334 RepID=X8CN93_MYCXE|nr:putative conserved membrane protein [Mycobacterium xenopi 4042]
MTATTKLAIVVGIFAAGLAGWSIGGYLGAAAGLVLGLAGGVIRWRGHPLWYWLILWRQRGRPIELSEPITVANDRTGGGVRYQDGVAVVAVQLLGKAHRPTLFTGSTATYTENTVDIAGLLPLLRQSLGLTIDSLSVVSAGARRRSTGDYPRVYDTLIGTPPYAGQRETWLIIRIAAIPTPKRCSGARRSAPRRWLQDSALVRRCASKAFGPRSQPRPTWSSSSDGWDGLR